MCHVVIDCFAAWTEAELPCLSDLEEFLMEAVCCKCFSGVPLQQPQLSSFFFAAIASPLQT
jgi:hypothetical protein